MVFSEIPFLFYFLPLFLICYFISPARFKNLVLLIFSLFFYAWGEPVYILLLLLSSVVDYINGRALEHFKGKRRKQLLFLCVSIIVNVGLMGIFKYAGLFITTINSVFGTGIKDPELALPLGISFFTFQTMSYSIDVYRGQVKAEHNFLRYMTYVCMFPQLVAGPIVRYEDISKELKERKVTWQDFQDGTVRFLMGLFKKVLIANQVGSLWDYILALDERSFAMAWLGLLAFSLQIYFDFSGYSDMAIGLGRMMGFHYPENFNYPYICTSITDFWRRWHMTLSGWFRDYVYIPLGGNRKGKARQILNIAIVWALTGFWHGAAWTFLLWGVYFGIVLIIEKLTRLPEHMPAALRHVYSLVIVMLGWMIFAVEDIRELGRYASQVFGFGAGGFADKAFLYQAGNYSVILIAGVILSTPVFKKVRNFAENGKTAGAVLSAIGACVGIILVAVCIAMLVADSYNPFLYFRF
ncbi:MAG: MBOAT family O-acyltransferase [Lachnospiraceae bacterium]